MDAELFVDVLEVLAHRARRDPEELGDLGVRLPRGQQVDDLGLTSGEERSALPLFEEQGAVDEVDDDGLLALSTVRGSGLEVLRRSRSHSAISRGRRPLLPRK